MGEPLKGHEGAVNSAAFSPDGRRIVTASADRSARLWDAETGKPMGEPLKGHEDAVLSAAFSPDGQRIVTASDDRSARLWDAETGKPVGEPLKGHEAAVNSAAFSPDGRRIVTASEDKSARLWDAETGNPVGEPLKGHEDAVISAAFSPDGRRIVTASKEIAQLWESRLFDKIEDLLPRCLSEEQRTNWRLSQVPNWCFEKKKYPYSPMARLVSASRFVRSSRGAQIEQDISELSKLIAEIEADSDERLTLREARFLRGQAYLELGFYDDAMKDFKTANELGEADAQIWAWWTSERQAYKMLAEGEAAAALVQATNNHLALTPRVAGIYGADTFRSDLMNITQAIEDLHLKTKQNQRNATECDRLASHPDDPMSMAAGVLQKKIEAKAAISACSVEIDNTPDKGRFYYLRGLAYSRAADAAKKAMDDGTAENQFRSALADFESARTRDYFPAFNNLARAYENGEGVPKDKAKAAALRLEAFNRVVACCAAPVINALLNMQGLDKEQAQPVANALLSWAAALGDPIAHRDLAELYLKGTLSPPPGKSRAAEAYFHFTLAEKLFTEQKQVEAAKAAEARAKDLVAKIPPEQRAVLTDETERWAKELFTADPPWLRFLSASN
jgi:tetratricopeptide (TPR) repeat protein